MMICVYLFVIHQHSCHVRISRGLVVTFQLKNIIQCVVGNFKSGVNFPIIMVYISIPYDQIIIVVDVESYSKYKHCWIDLNVLLAVQLERSLETTSKSVGRGEEGIDASFLFLGILCFGDTLLRGLTVMLLMLLHYSKQSI